MSSARANASPTPARTLGFGAVAVSLTPHSATRFVLPFTLDLARLVAGAPRTGTASATSSPVYRKTARGGASDWIGANLEAREKYLTAETRYVLFQRATWWVMECDDQRITMTAPDGVVLEGVVRPPAVVLFEPDSGEDLLRRGFLVVEVAFKGDGQGNPRLDDLLLFNELFRYWREPWTGHSKEFAKQLEGFNPPFRAQTHNRDNEIPTSAYLYAERWLSLLRVPLEDGSTLLPEGTSDAKQVFGDYADDRAFVWTRALVPEADLKRLFADTPPASGDAAAEADTPRNSRGLCGYWVKLLNADRPSIEYADGIPSGYAPWPRTNQASAFERDWAARHSYRRWEEEDCYYGFNSSSAAMMSKPPSPHGPATWQHWFQMYFDQVLLLLYLRVTLFGFSRKLTDISGEMLGTRGKPRTDRWLENWLRDFRHLRRAFTCFENLYQFPLLSNQQQAVEMYVCARRNMDIDALYAEIAQEVRSSDELLEAEVDRKRSDYAHTLNTVAAVGLGLSVALSCYQIAGFQAWWEKPFGQHSGWATVVWAFLWVAAFLGLVEVLKGFRKFQSPRATVPPHKS